jgi:23S rRNA (adenine2503-C2)-methyltransferase
MMAALVGNAGRLIASSVPLRRTPRVCAHRLICFSASTFNAQSASPTFSNFPGFDDAGNRVSSSGTALPKISLKDMTFLELQSWVESHGHKASRTTILWRHLYGSRKWAESPNAIPLLNKAFVSLLEERTEFAPNLQLRDVHMAKDGTRKLVFFLEEYNASIETVVIPGPKGRITVCVSSQIGCAMNCQFCFTAKMGLWGNLSTAQIVEQVVVASRMCLSEFGEFVTNVVFMGMGEPLHNLDSVLRVADIMVSNQGLHLSPRKVTISTSGLVPKIRTFCRTSKCALAVSLNATTDETRDRIIPINRKYNIQTLLDCVKEEIITYWPGETVFFEYVMLKDVNDSEDDERRLVELVKDIPYKINLITFNLHPGSPFESTLLDEVLKFRDRVADAGIVVHIRNSRGDDEKMACGQLGIVLPRPPRRQRIQETQQPA